jgi:hypothetical protein
MDDMPHAVTRLKDRPQPLPLDRELPHFYARTGSSSIVRGPGLFNPLDHMTTVD